MSYSQGLRDLSLKKKKKDLSLVTSIGEWVVAPDLKRFSVEQGRHALTAEPVMNVLSQEPALRDKAVTASLGREVWQVLIGISFLILEQKQALFGLRTLNFPLFYLEQ